jgi:hypothetical protein
VWTTVSDEPTYNLETLGRAMSDRRTRLHLTQQKCVDKIERAISLPQWSKMENGHPGRYKVASFAAIDKALDWEYGTALALASGGSAVESSADVNSLNQRVAALEEQLREMRESLRQILDSVDRVTLAGKRAAEQGRQPPR